MDYSVQFQHVRYSKNESSPRLEERTMGSHVSCIGTPVTRVEPKYRVTPAGAGHVGPSDIGQFLLFLTSARRPVTALELGEALRADIDTFHVEVVAVCQAKCEDTTEYDELVLQHERILRNLPSIIKDTLKTGYIEELLEEKTIEVA